MSEVTAGFDLDSEVELLEPEEGSLAIARRRMSMREAVVLVLAKSPEGRALCGIGLHSPLPIKVGGRPALQSYLSGTTVAALYGDGSRSGSARAVVAPAGEDDLPIVDEIAAGDVKNVIAMALAMPPELHSDIYVYVDELTALPLAEAKAWMVRTSIH